MVVTIVENAQNVTSKQGISVPPGNSVFRVKITLGVVRDIVVISKCGQIVRVDTSDRYQRSPTILHVTVVIRALQTSIFENHSLKAPRPGVSPLLGLGSNSLSNCCFHHRNDMEAC